MTPEEAKRELDSIVKKFITVYERRLYGEEIQPFIVDVQKSVAKVQEYIDMLAIRKDNTSK
ncbi:MAG: hypothetical protein JO011_15160 [Ktedonobacteraceae bacterium]|nr:hypothetical protein [Ktedonobacteraceae bacterium]